MSDILTSPLRLIAYLCQFWMLSIRYQLTWGFIVNRADTDQFYYFNGAAIDELRAKWRMPHRRKG